MPSGDGEPFVIGQQMADAHAREQSHRAAWSGPHSPLTDVSYSVSKGEGDLLRLRPAVADATIGEFIDRMLGAVDADRLDAQVEEVRVRSRPMTST